MHCLSRTICDTWLSVYETRGRRDAPTTSVEESEMADAEALSAWLASLAPPTGLFVCYDIRGQQVLNACSGLGLSVPDDVGVIGVDDDDAICPLLGSNGANASYDPRQPLDPRDSNLGNLHGCCAAFGHVGSSVVFDGLFNGKPQAIALPKKSTTPSACR